MNNDQKFMNNDPTKFRTTLICSCNSDAAEGYGPTREQARANAIKFFRKAHGRRATWRDEFTEVAVEHGGGGSHYEEST